MAGSPIGSGIFACYLAIVLPAAGAAGRGPLPSRTLLDRVQRGTFQYFWELGHPRSGMAPERRTTPEVVTTGGTGFGLMGLVVGAERGFVSRGEILDRVARIVDFLGTADRFHGAWPHWLDGATGKVRPFSPRDDGADLVETAYLVAGLMTARRYFDRAGPEAALGERIDALVDGVEWTWFTRGGERVLYWHWSPRHGWAMNLPIVGYHEALITYVLAAGSRTDPIDPEVYHQGWAGGDRFVNGEDYHGIELPLGPPYGGPLFLSQYSFLGLDPRGLSDRYADYWVQNVRHTLIHRRHCALDPNRRGYGPFWGLTSSDAPWGYDAHSPANDTGVIAPTGALSAFPYTPRQSWAALVAFLAYEEGRLWTPTGFRDAFQPSTGWVAEDQLAIDQGPILVMIENHRSGRIWDLFMSCPGVRRGLARLGFTRTVPPRRRR